MPSWSLQQFIAHAKRKDRDRTNSDTGSAGKAPIVEQAVSHESLGKNEIASFVRGRYTVRYTSVRRRLLDDEDQATKYATDALVGAYLENDPAFRILPGDRPHQVSVKTRQRKCRPGEPEHYIIEIFEHESEALDQ